MIFLVLVMEGRPAYAQETDVRLERRVEALEKYVSTFQPTLVELSDNLNKSIQGYTKGLESNLNEFSKKLQMNIDERINSRDNKMVILNPFSSAFQTIQTNTGNFLIAVERVQPIENGVRLHLQIGNPNYADFSDFKLKLVWGQKWGGTSVMPYEQWRQSLNGIEYTFQGKIAKGKWNAMAVDLTPVGQGYLGHLECEMNVTSVELEYSK